MKILSAQQIQEWDAFTIANEPVASIDLMERASAQCTDFIISRNFIDNIKIFCGKGNNGGDGLAIARQLIASGFAPNVYIIEFGAKGTDDFQINLQRLHELTTNIYFIQSSEFFPALEKDDVIIDALYGSGLNRKLEGLSAQLVAHINAAEANIISIDVPGGMPIDKSCAGNTIIKADHTLTFQSLKLCFLMPENADFFGEVKVLDIGLDESFTKDIDTAFQLTTAKDVEDIFQPRKTFSNKGTYGHALLIAGNIGKMGAAIIASRACLRAGAGLLTVNIPETTLSIIQTAIPEAMCEIRNDKNENKFEKYSSIGIGPGINMNDGSAQLLHEVLLSSQKRLVIDADALTILSQNKEWLNLITKDAVLTPHPKEFDRLFGKAENDFERINKAIELSKQYPFILVLKGHYTLIAAAGKGFFNTTGNAGMAKGGSGDMLTGIITSLLAQKYKPLQAAIFGVYIHGLAADMSLHHQSYESLLPSDVIEHLGKAFKYIAEGKED
jgi:ADP-dependent NAD(P)H-hydrate dehydratase / NAD(P)H-hydrate epimerase